MYPEEDYFATAKRAYHYIQDYFLDREHGGVFWELDHRGSVSSARKQVYAIAFTIYAMAEYHMACGDQQALQTAIALFRDIESHAMDPARNGYIEALARDWSPVEDLRLSEKDHNESKTMNTHLHILEAYGNLSRVWKDPAINESLGKIIQLFLDHFVNPENFHLNLFFDDHWNLKSSLISYGHDIECSWLLYEAAQIIGAEELIEQTRKLAVLMAKSTFGGLDRDGALFYEYFPEKEEYDTDKHWWPQAEAMVGYFNAYELSGEEVFAEKTLDVWRFIREHLVDPRYGEWYWSVNREGIPQTEKEKAGFWKCPYHNGRACMEMIRRINK
jgi:mannobiose 2-epimerase